MKSFHLDLPDDWKSLREVDNEGWLDIPSAKQANPSDGRLILVRMKDEEGVHYKLVDKKEYDKLVERLRSRELHIDDIGVEHKGEFFSKVDAVEYKSEGKVRLTAEHLDNLNTRDRVELRAADGGLEIRCPGE